MRKTAIVVTLASILVFVPGATALANGTPATKTATPFPPPCPPTDISHFVDCMITLTFDAVWATYNEAWYLCKQAWGIGTGDYSTCLGFCCATADENLVAARIN